MPLLNKKIGVLIVDDSPEFLEGLQMLFSITEDYEITDILTNGEELVQFPRIEQVDIILLDIEMPILNGIEAAKRINYNYPNKPMIALTMYIDRVYLLEIVEAGFKAFIHKPDIADRLFDTMDRVLKNEMVFPDNIKLNNK